MIKVELPLTIDSVRKLKAGDSVLISGQLYTARDAAHKRLVDLIDAGKELPFDLRDQTIYYVGPAPSRPGQIINSAGPTTSYRMDPYAPVLIENGLRGMIGKGERGSEVVAAMKEFGAVYFAAVGGAAALIAQTIKECEVIAYEDLGAEAIRRMRVQDFPAVVAQDCHGGNLYDR
jgi:fumarate hydratase subunit beta